MISAFKIDDHDYRSLPRYRGNQEDVEALIAFFFSILCSESVRALMGVWISPVNERNPVRPTSHVGDSLAIKIESNLRLAMLYTAAGAHMFLSPNLPPWKSGVVG